MMPPALLLAQAVMPCQLEGLRHSPRSVCDHPLPHALSACFVVISDGRGTKILSNQALTRSDDLWFSSFLQVQTKIYFLVNSIPQSIFCFKFLLDCKLDKVFLKIRNFS